MPHFDFTRSSRVVAVTFAALFSLIALGGCQSRTSAPSRAAGPRDVLSDVDVWDTPAGHKTVPGIDYAAVTYYLWNDHLVVALWSDNNDNLGARNFSGGHLYGSIDFLDKRPSVQFDGNTPDGRNGTLTVNGQKFDLSNGSLFLIATSNGSVRLKQLQREGLARINSSGQRESFQKLKTDPDIVEFFAQDG